MGFTTRPVERGSGGVLGKVINDESGFSDPKLVEVELEIEGLGTRHGLLDALSALPTIKAISFDDENE